MGHGDSSERFRGHYSACGISRGFSSAAEGVVNASMSDEQDDQASPPQEVKSLGVRASLFALSLYKAYLSSLFAGTCRYEPTCSRYAYEAIERFGVLRGGWLAFRRLMRCHPLSRTFGYDPVPEKWEQMRATSELLGKTREARP